MYPHRFCLVDTGLTELFTLAHVGFFCAYMTCASLIWVSARGRGYSFLPKGWLDHAFAMFILLCGAGHGMAAITLWFGSRVTYVIEVAVLLVGMACSILTAFEMYRHRRELARPPVDELATKLRTAEAEREALRAIVERIPDTPNGKLIRAAWALKAHEGLLPPLESLPP